MKTMLRGAPAALLAVLLAACGGTTIHSPGEYKGAADPDATPEAAQARAEALRERALRAHTDR